MRSCASRCCSRSPSTAPLPRSRRNSDTWRRRPRRRSAGRSARRSGRRRPEAVGRKQTWAARRPVERQHEVVEQRVPGLHREAAAAERDDLRWAHAHASECRNAPSRCLWARDQSRCATRPKRAGRPNARVVAARSSPCSPAHARPWHQPSHRRSRPAASRACEDVDVSTAASSRSPRLTAVMREGERVTPLELFFDLVFVLALTQCTALMAADPTWAGSSRACSCWACCGGRGSATPG